MIDRDDCIVAALRLCDVYGDSGLVGAAIVSLKHPRVELDAFLISCRVLGRGAEEAFLAAITQAVVEQHSSGLVARYIPTRKNALVADFLPRSGLTLLAAEDSSTTYGLEEDSIPLPVPTHICLENELCGP